MKKRICMALLALLCMSATACGNETMDVPKESNVIDERESNSKLSSGDESERAIDSSDNTESGNKENNQEDFFKWSPDGTVIWGYSELGLKQTEIVIPDKCVSVDVSALSNNPTVKNIVFENPDTKISDLRKCTALESVTLPANLTEINQCMFEECKSLKSIEMPEGITIIESSAFTGCESLEDVKLNEGLQIIETGAFEDCKSLKSLIIPDSVTTIEFSAFENCSALDELKIGAGMTVIEHDVFAGCAALKEVNIPEGITIIEHDAFRDCTTLKEVRIPEGVTEIGILAFAGCDSLENVYLPSTLTELKKMSFYQEHDINVYVVKDSYVDAQITESPKKYEYIIKQYQ